MDISVRTTAYTVEDRSWLGSRDGTSFTESITLDVSTFSAVTHYPNGYIPSGTVLSLLANGKYGPYAGSPGEVQTVSTTGGPTGGTFTLSFGGQTTAAIQWNATAAAVQSALEALANINVGDVTVTGGPGPATPWVVTFGGRFAGENVPLMTATASLTGGTTPNITIVETTAGGGTGSGGTQTAVGFLFNTTAVRTGLAGVGAPLLWRGVIKTSRLPAASGLDATARTQLAAKFRFK